MKIIEEKSKDEKDKKRRKQIITISSIFGAILFVGVAYFVATTYIGGTESAKAGDSETTEQKEGKAKVLKELGLTEEEAAKQNADAQDQIVEATAGDGIRVDDSTKSAMSSNDALKNYYKNNGGGSNSNKSGGSSGGGKYTGESDSDDGTSTGGPSDSSNSEEEVADDGTNNGDIVDTSEYIPLMILELSNKSKIVSDAIANSLGSSDEISLEYRILNYNLRYVTGQDKEPNWDLESIDDLKVDNWTRIIENWLFLDYQSNFSWLFRTEGTGEYKNFYESSLYKKSWNDVYSPVLSIITDGTKVGPYDVNATMTFASGGKMYVAYYSIQNSGFLLLDVKGA